MLTNGLSDKPTSLSTSTNLSELRRARAEAVLQILPPSSRRTILNIRELADEIDLTVRQVEMALDDLASAGRVELMAMRGFLRVRRLDTESEVSK